MTSKQQSLRDLLGSGRLLRLLEAHSAASGLVAAHAVSSDGERSFDGLWSSSLTDSAVRALPDREILDARHRLPAMLDIVASTGLPIVADIDSGGSVSRVRETCRLLERSGVAALCLEDKIGEKHNSLLDNIGLHHASPIQEFTSRIAAAKDAQASSDFMVFARVEGLILGQSEDEIMDRATSYIHAGADGLVLHSKDPDPTRLLDVANRMRRMFPQTPLIAIPTAYPTVTETQLEEAGFSLVIYANHLFRASIQAMRQVSLAILDGQCADAADDYCISVRHVFDLAEISQGRPASEERLTS